MAESTQTIMKEEEKQSSSAQRHQVTLISKPRVDKGDQIEVDTTMMVVGSWNTPP